MSIISAYKRILKICYNFPLSRDHTYTEVENLVNIRIRPQLTMLRQCQSNGGVLLPEVINYSCNPCSDEFRVRCCVLIFMSRKVVERSGVGRQAFEDMHVQDNDHECPGADHSSSLIMDFNTVHIGGRSSGDHSHALTKTSRGTGRRWRTCDKCDT
jgi:hypothetical protein